MAPVGSVGSRLGLGLATVLLAGCGGLFYQPTSLVYADPTHLGLRQRELSIPRPGGGKLAAAWIEGPDSVASRGLLVQFHGNAQNLSAHWTSFHWAVRRGWRLLAWDYSGYGASDGEPSRAQIARDARAFLDWVSDSILPHQRGPVVLVGQSLGSAILLRAFPEWKDRDKATLVVSECGFPTYRSIARDVVSRHWLTWIAYPFVPLLVSEAESPAPWIPRVAPTPFLVLSCKDDQVVPAPLQERIHAMAPGSFLWTTEKCRHIGALRTDSLRKRFETLVDSLSQAHAP